jgi:hypothetical protein
MEAKPDQLPSKAIPVRVFGYPRSRDHAASARPFKPERSGGAVLKLPRRLLPRSRAREDGAGVGADGDPRTAAPYLRLGAAVPRAEQYSDGQQRACGHPGRGPDEQTPFILHVQSRIAVTRKRTSGYTCPCWEGCTKLLEALQLIWLHV